MASDWITIDGGQGEAGGQIVRTSLALACITGRPLKMIRVRAGRPKPGLANQHLTAIRAAARISSAKVRGAEVGSREFRFEPGAVEAGDYSFDIGTAGSTTLVLQTIALPLALATGTSRVSVTGGTHNPLAPCFEYLESVWAPLVALAGIHVYLQLKRAGFYPAGGGRIEATIAGIGSIDKLTHVSRVGWDKLAENQGGPSQANKARIDAVCNADILRASDGPPQSRLARPTLPVGEKCGLTAVTIEDRGELYSIDGFSAVARLPLEIAERQAARAERRLTEFFGTNPSGRVGRVGESHHAAPETSAGKIHPLTCQTIDAASPGTVLFLNARSRGCPAAFFGLGARGKPAESVADEAVEALVAHFARPGALDPHAADQFLLPLALAAGGSAFTTTRVTDHLVTHAALLRQFLGRRIELTGAVGEPGRAAVS